jgi:small multidrug resistance pump
MTITQILFLLLTIGFEVLGTVSLKLSEGFTKLIPSILVVVGYGLSFYLLSLLLKQNVPIGIIYAVWSGLGTVAIVLIGVWLWGERLSIPAIVGIAMVIIGVVLINLTTKSAH